jgi:hypothetical protein
VMTQSQLIDKTHTIAIRKGASGALSCIGLCA